MIVGIDAFNIRAGGGVIHLVELLRAANPYKYGISKVIVWGSSDTLSQLDSCEWLQKVQIPCLDGGLLRRILWQKFRLKKLAREAQCSLLFSPGGSDSSGFRPIISMSQNLLPFEWMELRRFGWSLLTVKFLILRWTQAHCFKKSDAIIFLTKYARTSVLNVIGRLSGETAIIHHGINPSFNTPPRRQRSFAEFTDKHPCRVLYVSVVDVYKHQWHVAEAVAQLRAQGLPIILELIGPPANGVKRLKEVMTKEDPGGNFIFYRGAIPHQDLVTFYLSADICVFASSCETFGQILTEAMRARLPIACSNLSAMPEILGDAGIYFDPESVNSIANSINLLMGSADLRERLSNLAFNRSQAFSWERCADETFKLFYKIAEKTIPRNVL